MPLYRTEDQSLSIGPSDGATTSIAGLQSVDCTQEVALTPISCLGIGFLSEEALEPIRSEVSLERYVLGDGNYFTEESIKGTYTYGAHGITWGTGRISSFEMSAEANSVATERITIEIYDGFTDAGSFSEPAVGEVAITNNITTNLPFDRIRSVNYSVTINKDVSYRIGTSEVDVLLKDPHEVVVSLSINVDSEVDVPMKVCAPTTTSITITLNDCDGNQLRTYSAPNAKLQSVTLRGIVNDFMVADISYKTSVKTEDLGDLMP